jgi:hypothetical protein
MSMKMNPAINCSLLAVLFLATVFFTGCATTPPVDWNNRVGHYTYAEAVREFGPPNRQLRQSSGETKFKWFVQSDGIIGMPYARMNNVFDMGQPAPPTFTDRYLELTFDTKGVLTAWSKNY